MAMNLVSIKDKAKRGPLSEGSLRWLIFNERQNGLRESGAIVRIRKRVFVNEEKFDAWILAQNPQQAAA
jgi:hypothetical protein